jgi:nucleotide-binding universal stress UspA family protein
MNSRSKKPARIEKHVLDNTMKVLIAIEDEFFGTAVVDYVGHHTWPANTTMRLVNIVEPNISTAQIAAVYGTGYDQQLIEALSQAGLKLLNNMRKRLQEKLDSSIKIEIAVLIGRPQDRILELAEDWPADMMVLGSHGRKGFSRFLLGSVSLSVVSHAACTVTIVRSSSLPVLNEPISSKKDMAFQPVNQHASNDTAKEVMSSELPTAAMFETGLNMYE